MTLNSYSTIIIRKINELMPYARNARTHSAKQIKQIADSISKFGFTNPVLIDRQGMIIAGHGRVQAAELLKLKEVPTITLEHLTEDEVRAYILADNRLAEKAGWDKNILTIELQHLITLEADLDVTITGFDLPEIDLIIGTPAGDADDDDVEESKCKPVSQKGDIWLLGKHRLLCGDATRMEDIERLMDGKRAAMTFTDPPYNVDYKTDKHQKIANDALGSGFYDFLESSCCNLLSVTDGATYICMSSSELHTLQSAFLKAGGHWSTFIIWVKNTFTLGRSDYQRQYEPILYGWREGTTHQWCGDRSQGDVWFFDKPSRNDIHPTMKPVGLAMQAIRNSSGKGDIVLDPFLGSGTTLMAAERTGRICYGIELDPLYVDVIIRRWQKKTGQQAIHAETNKSFQGDVQ